MYFTEISPEDLVKLRDGLTILERLDQDSYDNTPYYLYGISSDEGVLSSAKESIAELMTDRSEDETQFSENDIELSEVVVEIPISGDVLNALLGSGIKLDKSSEFAYLGGEGEGIRELSFSWSSYKPTVTVKSFSSLAVARDSGWGDKFLAKHGNQIPMRTTIRRNEPANDELKDLYREVTKLVHPDSIGGEGPDFPRRNDILTQANEAYKKKDKARLRELLQIVKQSSYRRNASFQTALDLFLG